MKFNENQWFLLTFLIDFHRFSLFPNNNQWFSSISLLWFTSFFIDFHWFLIKKIINFIYWFSQFFVDFQIHRFFSKIFIDFHWFLIKNSLIFFKAFHLFSQIYIDFHFYTFSKIVIDFHQPDQLQKYPPPSQLKLNFDHFCKRNSLIKWPFREGLKFSRNSLPELKLNFDQFR
jgi:hypothetical protein